jgi:hypothetical protein
MRVLREGDTLGGGTVVPGLAIALAELFRDVPREPAPRAGRRAARRHSRRRHARRLTRPTEVRPMDTTDPHVTAATPRAFSPPDASSAASDVPIGTYARTPTYVVDTRDLAPDLFRDVSATDWSTLAWGRVKRPYKVERWAADKLEWERANGQPLPVLEGWKRFNANFHQLFATDSGRAGAGARRAAGRARLARRARGAGGGRGAAAAGHLEQDPPGRGRGVGPARQARAVRGARREAAEDPLPRLRRGYEAMQLLSMYPGGHAVLVDYDPFCRDVRWAEFPAAYPFLGADPGTGHRRVWRKEELSMEYVVADIRDLDYGAEFDIVLQRGAHRALPRRVQAAVLRLPPPLREARGWVLMTTPRDQLRSRAYYHVMRDRLKLRLPRADGRVQMGPTPTRTPRRAARRGDQGAQRAGDEVRRRPDVTARRRARGRAMARPRPGVGRGRSAPAALPPPHVWRSAPGAPHWRDQKTHRTRPRGRTRDSPPAPRCRSSPTALPDRRRAGDHPHLPPGPRAAPTSPRSTSGQRGGRARAQGVLPHLRGHRRTLRRRADPGEPDLAREPGLGRAARLHARGAGRREPARPSHSVADCATSTRRAACPSC